MRIVFAQNMIHLPTHGGANKSNRVLAELLAARGHECHLVAPLSGVMRTSDQDPDTLWDRSGARLLGRDEATVRYELGGVQVHGVRSPSGLVKRVRTTIAEVRPDWVLVPSDDPGSMVLATALGAAPDRVVYLTHTIQQLPFGPSAFYPSAGGTALVRRAAGTLAVSRAAQRYLHDWAGIRADLLYPPVYGSIPEPRTDDGSGAITMVNPCGYKGLPIFLSLAEAFPDLPFLAVPTWGTTADDRAQLARRPNIEIAEPVDDIGLLLRRTRVLVVPSLWDETFGYTCVDAMLRGIPVLASAVGGLTEAKLDVPYLLPVRRIESYDAAADRARPVPVIPPQDTAPWRDAVHRLLDNPAHWADVAHLSRAAAVSFVESLDEGALEQYLASLEPARVGG
ncbi:MAG TPA: glycosyltransferase family 4 protein [Trebonia sp.]